MNEINIGDRVFTVLKNGTLEHDYWCMSRLRMAGLDTLTIGQDESSQAYVERLIGDLMASGHMFEIMGGLLLPAPLTAEQWTPDVAADTAAFIRSRTDADDKRIIQQHVVSLVLYFFVSGLASSMTFPNFSQKATETSDEPQEPSAATTISAAGATWSASLLASIRGAITRFFAGQSGKH